MTKEDSLCPVCDTISDSMGDHHATYRGNGDMIRQHDSLCDVLFSAAQSAELAPKKETPSLIPRSSSCPADIFHPCWKRGKPATLDVTVISPVQQLTIEDAAITQGHALSVGETRKRRVHENDCREIGISFLPLVVESLGG